MKKWILLIILIFIAFGCIRNEEWNNPVPEEVDAYVLKLLQDGWNANAQKHYDIAYAKFDTVTNVAGKNPHGYIGRAITSIDFSGENPDYFIQADKDFKFVINLIEKEFSYDTTLKFQYYGLVDFPIGGRIQKCYAYYNSFAKNILSIAEPYNIKVIHDRLDAYDTLDLSFPYDSIDSIYIGKTFPDTIFAISNDTIYVRSIYLREFNFLVTGDDIFIPDSVTICSIKVSLPKDTLNWLSGLTALGYSQYYLIKSKNTGSEKDISNGIKYAKLVDLWFPKGIKELKDSLPSFYDERFKSGTAKILLAQAYLYLDCLYNSMWEVKSMNPSAILDPNSNNFFFDLQREIQNLKP